MTWIEFRELTIDEQLKIINDKLIEFGTTEKACNDLGFRRNTVRDYFKPLGYEYIKAEKQYIKVNDVVAPVKEVKVIEHKEEKQITRKVKIDEPIILELVERMNRLEEEIREMKQVPVNAVDTPYIREFEGQAMGRTLKVHTEAMRELSLFLNRYPNLLKQDVISTAILDYIDNYNK